MGLRVIQTIPQYVRKMLVVATLSYAAGYITSCCRQTNNVQTQEIKPAYSISIDELLKSK